SWRSGGLLDQDLVTDIHHVAALTRDRAVRGAGQVEAAVVDVRSAVVDADHQRLAVGDIGHAHLGVERQRGVGSGQPVGVELLAVRGLLAGVVVRSVAGAHVDDPRGADRFGRGTRLRGLTRGAGGTGRGRGGAVVAATRLVADGGPIGRGQPGRVELVVRDRP